MEMENETTALKWVFYREVDVPRDIEEILVTGEVADRAFKTARDVAVFTNKRLIVKERPRTHGNESRDVFLAVQRSEYVVY